MIVFDVGAHDGSSCLHLAVRDPASTVYGFEPTPRLATLLRQKTLDYPNYVVVNKAVSNYSGKARFNIAGQGDWGCSSLREFNADLEKAWPGRTDFHVTETVEVEVIKLADFIAERKIPRIDYLHVDVQGEDLSVLQGLEDKIALVQAGDVEAAANAGVALYQGQHTIDDVKHFLTGHGFTITNVESNDAFNNELNVYFKRL